jgi:hypothetical protein
MSPIAALDIIMTIPDTVPSPPTPNLKRIAATTVKIVGMPPNIRPLTLIKIERVSKNIPGFIVKGEVMIAMQIAESTMPLIHGCQRRNLVGTK